MSSVEALGWEDGQQAVIEFAGCEHPRPPALGRVVVGCVAVVVVVVGHLWDVDAVLSPLHVASHLSQWNVQLRCVLLDFSLLSPSVALILKTLSIQTGIFAISAA